MTTTDIKRHAIGASHVLVCACGLLVAITIGCDVPVAPPPKSGAPPEPKYVDLDSEEGQRLQEAREAQTRQAATELAPATSTVEDDTPDANREIVKAKPGAGKWKPYKAGFLTTPLNAYFSSKERISHLQIEDGLRKFHALQGRPPKDFAEADKAILKPARIRLPQLNAGDEYVFLPKQGQFGEFMIMRAEKK
jgi:hypothetical protein